MNIARITNISPDGTWNGPQGLIYQLLITFEDGYTGQANAKSENPPYRVGDEVGYEFKGKYPGGDKIKITAKPYGQGGAPSARPAAAPQTARPAQTPRPQAQAPRPAQSPATGQINGATVGMAAKAAVDILVHNAATQPVELATLQGDIEGIASAIIAACLRLESGKVKVDTEAEQISYQ